MSTQTPNVSEKPAPVWRLLEPGEALALGDQIYLRERWRNISAMSVGALVVSGDVVRRRMEPDPVKAELLAALKGVTHCLAWHVEDRKEGVAMDAKFLADARAAIARATT